MPLKDKVLFIHVPRTGGTSVTKAMGIDFYSSEEHLYCSTFALQHLTGKQLSGRQIDYNRVFSIARDPVMRMQSEWFLSYHKWRAIAIERKRTMASVFWEVCTKGIHSKGHYCHFASYSYMYEGIKNIRLLDHHNLQEDWEKMIDEWSLPFERKLEVLHSTKSRGREKMPYSLKQDIAQLYQEDYDLFKAKGFIWA